MSVRPVLTVGGGSSWHKSFPVNGVNNGLISLEETVVDKWQLSTFKWNAQRLWILNRMQKLTSNLWQAIKKFCGKSGWFIIAPLCAALSTFLSHIWAQRFSFVHEQSCFGSVWPGLRSELHPPAPPAALSHRQILLSYIWKITTLTISLTCTLISYMNNSCRYICRYTHIFTQ